MAKEKKFLFISIISIFNLVVILILTFFYFKLQKKSNNLQNKIIEISKSNTSKIEHEIHEEKEEILDKFEQEFKEQESFIQNFQKLESRQKLEKIKQQIENLKKTFQQNKQDQKTKKTFEKYKKYFEDNSKNALDLNQQTNFKELTNFMDKYLKMCEIKDKLVSELEVKNQINLREDPSQREEKEKNVQTLRTYLNGYAFLLNITLEKVEQITLLIESSSSEIEQKELKNLRSILKKDYTKFLLELIKTERKEEIIRNLLNK